MKKTVYSPQLNEVFTVVDENNSAYITKEGAYLSKKMAQKWEDLEDGKQVYLSRKLKWKKTWETKNLVFFRDKTPEDILHDPKAVNSDTFTIDNDVTPPIKEDGDIDWVDGCWFITDQFKEKEARKLKDKIEIENLIWGFDEELFRSDINKTVNQDFYD